MDTRPLRRCGGRDQALGNQAIDGTGFFERYEPGHCLPVVRDRDLVTIANNVEVATEMISKFSHASFHTAIMALSLAKNKPYSIPVAGQRLATITLPTL